MTTATRELTEREREVISLAAQGLTDETIGVKLFVSVTTVRKALESVYCKLGALNKYHATALAVRRGLCTISDSNNPQPIP